MMTRLKKKSASSEHYHTKTIPTMMVFFPSAKRSGNAAQRLLLFVLLGAFVCFTNVAQAIYPDDHWNYATALTQETFDTFIADAIAADKSAFVRWIASPG
jgi:hypothetical protein